MIDVKEILEMYDQGLITAYELEYKIINNHTNDIKSAFDKNETVIYFIGGTFSRDRVEPVFGLFQENVASKYMIKLSFINIFKMYWNKFCFFINKDSWQFKFDWLV